MTSEVKGKATSPSLFDQPVMDCRPERRDPAANEGSLDLDLQKWRDQMLDAQALADLYVAAWNEQDAAKRSSAIAALWAPDALGNKSARRYASLTRGSPSRPLQRTPGARAFAFAPPRPPASAATS